MIAPPSMPTFLYFSSFISKSGGSTCRAAIIAKIRPDSAVSEFVGL
jgi:hypothetical protein